ncbi:unnamed protein product, partial [Ectocarpus sp. 12 AP-2014]
LPAAGRIVRRIASRSRGANGRPPVTGLRARPARGTGASFPALRVRRKFNDDHYRDTGCGSGYDNRGPSRGAAASRGGPQTVVPGEGGRLGGEGGGGDGGRTRGE